MTEENRIFLIDTNVLVYAYEKEQSAKKRIAQDLIGRCWKGSISFAISAQNLAEFVFVATKKAKLEIKAVIKEA